MGIHLKYQMLQSLREKSFTFWNVIYPLIMGLLFFIAFQRLMTPQPLSVRVGVPPGSVFEEQLQSADGFQVQPLHLEAAKTALSAKTIDGYLDETGTLLVNQSGFKQSVLYAVAAQAEQMNALGIPLYAYDFSKSYTQIQASTQNPWAIPFYSLIGMVALYSVYAGVEYARAMQANQSTVALRMNVVPLKKRSFLFGGFVTGILLNFGSNLILLAFLRWGLGLHLTQNLAPTLLLVLLGNLLGLGVGLFIGASNHFSQNFKNMMAVGLTLFMASLSGMMSPEVKTVVQNQWPLLDRWNPVAIITTELYRVNDLHLMNSFYPALVRLSLLTILFFALALLFLRRKTYESL
ncbi:hypothetical protein ABB02_00581 [Clostridiaceae bacterium JG1575]|nr:hypothetical protein ABB02_00581 [Clostridiaceae bacterium JG1575]